MQNFSLTDKAITEVIKDKKNVFRNLNGYINIPLDIKQTLKFCRTTMIILPFYPTKGFLIVIVKNLSRFDENAVLTFCKGFRLGLEKAFKKINK